MKIIYFGTPVFAAEVLAYLLQHQLDIAAVITKPDRPKGRSSALVPTPVKEIAQLKHLPIYQPEKVSAPEFAPILEDYKPDLFVVVAYGEILKQHLLEMPKIGCINLHASLLPYYRGAAPIQRAIINGESETGITIMHMAKKMDAGDMIRVEKVSISPEINFGELEKKLCAVGSRLLLEVIQEFKQGVITHIPQDHQLATLAPKIELEECEIDWTHPALLLHNLTRGVNPYPGAWCTAFIKGQKLRLKIWKTQSVPAQGIPGQILAYGREGILVACGQDALLIQELQAEGKRKMTSEEFVRGIPLEHFALISPG